MTMVHEVTVREAARRVRKSPETIRRWIWSGRLPATKRGNTYYVDVAHLDGLTVELADAGHAPADGSLGTWLAEVAAWKSGLTAAGSAGTGTGTGAGGRRTASELVVEDRHARR